MIDWSSSDYTKTDDNLFYTPDIPGGLYSDNNEKINNSFCYKCPDNIQLKIDKNEELNKQLELEKELRLKELNNVLELSKILELQKESRLNNIENFSQPVSIPMSHPVKSTDINIPVNDSNFISGSINSFMILIFITLLIFMVYIEYRISTLYKTIINNTNNRYIEIKHV